MRRNRLTHEFVDLIPTVLAEGHLYVSIPYRTAIHLCACGCGNKVVTPIRPARWQLYFDGESVSLAPSVGNWQFKCRSHYVIKNDRVLWARSWTREEVEAGREHDQAELRQYLSQHRASVSLGGEQGPIRPSWPRRFWRRLFPH